VERNEEKLEGDDNKEDFCGITRASGTMKEQEIKSIKAFTSADRKD
jgi:hypothetical protein